MAELWDKLHAEATGHCRKPLVHRCRAKLQPLDRATPLRGVRRGSRRAVVPDRGDAVCGDAFALDSVRDRIQAALTPDQAAQLNGLMEQLHVAVGDEDWKAASDAAESLRKLAVPR